MGTMTPDQMLLPLDGPWPVDATWGEVTGPFASKIQAKHFDHHLRQFNA